MGGVVVVRCCINFTKLEMKTKEGNERSDPYYFFEKAIG